MRIVFCLLVVLLAGCGPQPPEQPPTQPLAFEKVSSRELPRFEDDLGELQSLRTALERSLEFYGRIPSDRAFALGATQVSAATLKASLGDFLALLDAHRLQPDEIGRRFDVYRSHSGDPEGQMLVTGYYEPVLEGRLESDRKFCYPLYGLPPDLVTVDLAAFDPERFSGERVVGRVVKNRLVPYYTRAEIDGAGTLERSGAQIVWVEDPVDAFFLQVQGSGRIHLPDGSFRRLGYAGANGRPYRSIGKLLLEKGLLKREEMSLQSIRACLKAHPELREEVLSYNESYVFFRWVEQGPVGSINVVLTAGRSIATDPRLYPKGALGFLELEKPRLDETGQVIDWEPLHRWVLNQDTGGAIKGAGRVDLFCGNGEAAEKVAGRLKQPGTLYILVKKSEAGN